MKNIKSLKKLSTQFLLVTNMTALVAISGLSINANADYYKYYKSVGPNGETFYTQFAPRGVKAELVTMRSDGRREQVGSMNGQTNSQPTVKKKSQQELRIEALEKEKAQRAQEEVIRKCQKLRENLTQLNIGGRLYETGPNGERNYMSDEKIAQQRESTQARLAQFCRN